MYIRAMKDMDEGDRTSVRTSGRVANDFYVGLVLHQGSTLKSFLFTLVLDELTKMIQDVLSWCILFVDDIVLIDRDDINNKLEQ